MISHGSSNKCTNVLLVAIPQTRAKNCIQAYRYPPEQNFLRLSRSVIFLDLWMSCERRGFFSCHWALHQLFQFLLQDIIGELPSVFSTHVKCIFIVLVSFKMRRSHTSNTHWLSSATAQNVLNPNLTFPWCKTGCCQWDINLSWHLLLICLLLLYRTTQAATRL